MVTMAIPNTPWLEATIVLVSRELGKGSHGVSHGCSPKAVGSASLEGSTSRTELAAQGGECQQLPPGRFTAAVTRAPTCRLPSMAVSRQVGILHYSWPPPEQGSQESQVKVTVALPDLALDTLEVMKYLFPVFWVQGVTSPRRCMGS